MSDNASEIDQMTGEFTSLGHKVNHLISTWRMTNPTATRVPRRVRQEINRLIKADNQEREFAHAQERARIERAVIEYRWKLLRDREIRSWDTQATWFERQRLLAAQHEQLRAGIYTATHLTATERGQADRVLAAAHVDPHTPVPAVFGKPRGLNALKARLHDGYTRLRAGLAGPAEQRRLRQWQQLRQERITRPAPSMDRRNPLLGVDPDRPIDLVPVDVPAPGRTPAASAPVQPKVTLAELTARIDLYAEVLRYRGQYTGNPAQMRPFDRDNARMRERILADARRLGPDHAALIETALSNIDRVHSKLATPDRQGPAEHQQKRTSAATDVDRDTTAPAQGTAPVEQDRGYEVVLATSEFLREHPELADRAEAATLADGYEWALDQLGDDAKGWPVDAELTVEIRRAGDSAPTYRAVGPRGMVIDEVVGWQSEHEQTPLAEIEQLRSQLRAARAENDQLRTENTELVRKFADTDLAQRPTAAAPTPKTPTGPRLAQPIFSGPVITRPVLNGLDR